MDWEVTSVTRNLLAINTTKSPQMHLAPLRLTFNVCAQWHWACVFLSFAKQRTLND